VVAGVALINLFVFGFVALFLYQNYVESERSAELTAQNLSRLLAQDIAGDMDKVDLTLVSAADEVQRQLTGGDIDRQALNAFLERQQRRLPTIFSLRITDANGIVLLGSDVDPAARQNNSDREYFVRQRDAPGAGLVIVKPVFTRLDKRWAIPVSRPIRLPDGSFGGVVYANISLDHVANTLATIDVGQHGSVSLRDVEQRVLAVYPVPVDIDKVIGEKLAIPELQELIRTGRDAGTYVTAHTVDGVERKFAANRLPDYPLYVVVGRATEEYMARWRDQALKTALLAVLFCLTTLVSSWLAYRGWRRQQVATMELAREEEKFHTVADYTYDWEYWEGPAQEILFMSPSCERVTGYSPSEFLAEPDLLYRITLPEDLHLMTAHRHDVEHEDQAAVDFRIVRRDGEIRWIAHGCRAVFGHNGKFMGRRVNNRDVTERKQVEHEMRLAYAYNRSLIEASVDPLVTIGPDGKITDVNSATEAVTGRARNELIGTEFSDYFSDPAHARAGYQQVFREGRVRDYELELRHRDGHLTPVRYNASIYRDDAGQILGVFAAARDISEQRQAEAAVHRLNDELEQRVAQRTAELEAANKELEEFSYSISHDLRTPLRAISGFAQILVDEHSTSLDSEGLRLLDVVGTNTARMGQLIDELLEFLQLGRRPMEFGPVDTVQLVEEVFAELQASVPERRLQLELKNPPALWGDRTMIRRLLKNLVSNAIKFTRPRRQAVIEVGGSRDAHEGHYWVKDNGVGFDMKYVDKLFRVFEHAHPAGQFEGSGTGLAMVRRIVARHGGRVWAEGQVDTGSTFHFTLPIKEAPNGT
jgi:PAS domain S-box-containing protein